MSIAREESTLANKIRRQLGREGQEEKDYRHWTYAIHEGRSTKVQEWLPDWRAKGFEGTCEQGRVKDASGVFIDLGMGCRLLTIPKGIRSR
jgi:hypothetical protein